MLKKIFKKIMIIMKNKKLRRVIAFCIEHEQEVNEYLDKLREEFKKQSKNKDVQMSLDYVPSWLDGTKTLLEKMKRVIEVTEENINVVKDGVVHAGDNITINDGTISAKGCFIHKISFTLSGYFFAFVIISYKATAYTLAEFISTKIYKNTISGYSQDIEETETCTILSAEPYNMDGTIIALKLLIEGKTLSEYETEDITTAQSFVDEVIAV